MNTSCEGRVKIALLPKYHRDGSSSRLRFYQYAETDPFSEFSIDVFPLYGKRYIHDLYARGKRCKFGVAGAYLRRFFLLGKLLRYDVVWLEKEFFPRLPATAEWVLSRLGMRYIVDYDDATFHDYDLSPNRVYRTLMRRKIDRVMSYSRAVICGNAYIQERANASGAPDTCVVPTVVDLGKYLLPENDNAVLTVGWIGTPPTEKYLEIVKRPVSKLLEKVSGRLLLVGVSERAREHFEGVSLTIKPWEEARETEYISQMDIGIMPLKDEPWERGKCGFKLLQYMAAGKPVVASPVGVNSDIVEGSGCGYLARTEEDWFNGLYRLARDAELRKILGAQGRKAVEQRYSLESQAERLAEIIARHSRPVKTVGPGG